MIYPPINSRMGNEIFFEQAGEMHVPIPPTPYLPQGRYPSGGPSIVEGDVQRHQRAEHIEDRPQASLSWLWEGGKRFTWRSEWGLPSLRTCVFFAVLHVSHLFLTFCVKKILKSMRDFCLRRRGGLLQRGLAAARAMEDGALKFVGSCGLVPGGRGEI